MANSVSTSPRWVSRRGLLRNGGMAICGLGLVPFLQACGADDDPATQSDDPIVEMNDEIRFVPVSLTIRAGQTVTWRNAGTMVHTATCDPAKAQDTAHAALPAGATVWDSDLIRAGESWSHTFDVAGEYAYFCIPHEAGGMVATLTVEEG